jgi:hypothetical protein
MDASLLRSLATIGRLTDNVDIFLFLKNLGQSSSEQVMIISYHNANSIHDGVTVLWDFCIQQ